MTSTLEKIAVVQCYIKLMKDKDVDISLPSNLRQLMLLDKAYNIAKEHIKEIKQI